MVTIANMQKVKQRWYDVWSCMGSVHTVLVTCHLEHHAHCGSILFFFERPESPLHDSCLLAS